MARGLQTPKVRPRSAKALRDTAALIATVLVALLLLLPAAGWALIWWGLGHQD
jgi:cytochrome b561